MKKGKIRMDRVRALRLLRDICMGLQHLNEAGISHRDVKSSNILLQCSHCPHTDGTMCLKDARSNLVAKLGDLGVSKFYGRHGQTHLETYCGTPRWMAPERLILQHSVGDATCDIHRSSSMCAAKCDVYSFGILAWEVVNYQITNKYALPFDDMKGKAMGSFLDGEYDSYNDGTLFDSTQSESRGGGGEGEEGEASVHACGGMMRARGTRIQIRTRAASVRVRRATAASSYSGATPSAAILGTDGRRLRFTKKLSSGRGPASRMNVRGRWRTSFASAGAATPPRGPTSARYPNASTSCSISSDPCKRNGGQSAQVQPF